MDTVTATAEEVSFSTFWEEDLGFLAKRIFRSG